MRALLLIASLSVLGCDAIEPKMTVTKDADVASFSGEDSCASEDFTLASDEAFYLYHELPKGVEPPEPLRIELETVCGSFSREADHVADQILRVPLAAPPGSECGVTVTATIANSSIQCSVKAKPEPCFDTTLCPEVEDPPDTTETGGTG